MLTPEQIANAVAADWIMGPIDVGDLIERITVALQSYGDERTAQALTGCVVGLRNAAYVVRQDGGAELRAKTFEDAAAICENAALT